MNQGWIYREQVKPKYAGLTVIEYYCKNYRHSSYQQWLERIILGQILLNNKITTADNILQTGQYLSYHRPPWEEPEVPLIFDIVYEDEHILVINKPSGLPVLPGGGFLEHTLLWQLKQQYPEDKQVPIHRLGRGTSGLMLIGRSALGRSYLTQQMREHKIKKVYRTLVGKSELPDNFIIDHPIGKIPHPILGYIYGAKADGKCAYSEAKVLERMSDKTLLEIVILTGRPHQIRIHLASVGYPLLGDPLYTIGGLPKINKNDEQGKIPVPGDCGYFLHSYQVSFIHPISNKTLNFTSNLSWTT